MYPPGSGIPPTIDGLTITCTPTGGQVDFSVNKSISGSGCSVLLYDQNQNPVWSGGISTTMNAKQFTVTGLADGQYQLEAANREASTTADVYIGCGALPPGLTLAVAHTDETAPAASDGTITLTPIGGTDPIALEVVELALSLLTSAGAARTFPAIPPATYTVRGTDSSTGQQLVSSSITVLPFVPVVSGCQDEYADNYDPTATTGGYATCTYTPLWRSAWQPMAVRVAAQAGQTAAFVAAELRIGFRPGHPLAADRPLGDPLPLRATVGPDGYATFILGPYLRSALGAPDGYGGYRLDLNSPSAFDADLYVGYELRRAGSDELVEHGYALNSAVPDAQLLDYLSPFYLPAFPVWPGFSDYLVTRRAAAGPGNYGMLYAEPADGGSDTTQLPCPLNPLPVRWLAPGSGYGFWVFQNRPQLGDTVGDGQQYRDALTGEQRFSDPGDAYQTYKASSGVFKGEALLRGLRTLWRSPQAWAQLEPGGPWVAIVVERGSRDVGRMGVVRNELSLSFSVAAPEFSQGQ